MAQGNTLAQAVSEARIWSWVMGLGAIGGMPNGGVNRQALTELDTQAKNHIAAWAGTRDLSVFQDEAANFYVRLEGSDSEASPVMIGSHLDSQPTGGKFDGAYGVVAGLEVLCAIQSLGWVPRRSIEVVSWTNEEGSRFQPGATGSSAFAGTRDLESMLDAVTVDGTKVVQDLHRSIDGTQAERRPMASVRPFAFLEAHIEQGPVLEARNLPIGIVTGVQGIRRMKLEFHGKTAHAGTTPHRLRSDAMVAATKVMFRLQPLAEQEDDVLRLTFGRIEVLPNSPNTVPNLVRITADLRHPDEGTLDAVTARIAEVMSSADLGCEATMETLSRVAPTHFSPDVIELLEQCAHAAGFANSRIVSGAGHDSVHLAKICPTGMVFVPCKDGVSHHESEFANAAQLAAGVQVLAAAAWELANRHE